MDAARLKRARRRLLGYFLGSGVVVAFLYLILATFLVHMVGIEITQYWSTVMIAAGVMLGGTYVVVMAVWLGAGLLARWKRKQPLWDVED
jgi:hypothetical protein